MCIRDWGKVGTMNFDRFRTTDAASLVLAGALMLGASSPLRADTVADFYSGKTITITVGFSPGGGYDLYARLAAQFLGRHLPGKPNVIVSNMPGGGGLRAAIHLFKAAPKDGTALTAIVQSVGFDSALGQLPVRADQFNYIGRMTTSVEMQLLWHTSPTKSLADAKSRKTVIGATGPSSPSTIVPKLLNDVIGTKFEIVGGYPGTSDSALAMERGEVEGTLKSLESILATNQDWLANKKVNIIWQLANQPHKRFPDVPAIGALGDDAEGRAIFRLIAGTAEIGRSLATAPGVPPDRIAALRRAFDAMIADPEFLASAKKRNAGLEPATGESLQGLIAETMSTPKAVVDRVRRVISAK
jgi:tripartite-type tricarboxylate transporter receptor subunit TctC